MHVQLTPLSLLSFDPPYFGRASIITLERAFPSFGVLSKVASVNHHLPGHYLVPGTIHVPCPTQDEVLIAI